MRVFVTGGSGFVGGHLIEALSGAHEVFAMARSETSAAKVEAFGAQAVRGSLEDVSAAMLEGIDVVVHAAAFVEEWGPDEVYWEANVDGTQRMLDAAQDAGVGRFVLVSTSATVFDGSGQHGVDEQTAYAAHHRFPYGRSKAEAERRVLAADRDGFRTVSLRPCFIWGPRDNTVLPVLERMAGDGSFLWLDQGRARVSTTHVANLVHAVECALVRGEGGAYFIADADDTTMRDFAGGLAASAGFALPGRSLPSWLVVPLASLTERVWSALGMTSTPPVTRMAALMMASDLTVRTERAREELGWRPVVERQAALADLAA